MKNTTIQILIAFTLVFIFSCNKDSGDKSNTESLLTYKNNIENYLTFPDESSFFEAIDLVGTTDNKKLQSIALNSGVKSYAAYYEEFLNKANDDQLSQTEYQNLLKEFADIITITDDVIKPRIENPLIWHIINRNGLVKVGNSLILYTESEKIISLHGNLDEIMNALETGNSSDEIIRYSYLVDMNSTKAACGSYQWVRLTVGDRRGELTCSIVIEATKNFSYFCQAENDWKWNFKSFAVSHGVPYKKNIWNNWVNYKTNNRLDLKYKATTFGVDPITGYPYEIIVQYNHVDGFDDFSKTHKQLIAEGIGCWSEQGNFQAYYNYMNPNRYTHRGLDHTNWATISCN